MNPILKIKKEFKELLPPLKEKEYAKLERDICIMGCIDPIRTWNGFILDGHHRYEICNKHNVEFRVTELDSEFKDETEAKIWMIDHQDGRRNLEAYQRCEMQMVKEYLEARKKNNQYTIEREESGAVNQLTGADHPSRRSANHAGVSHTTYFQAKYIAQHASEEEKEKLRNGKDTIKRVYKKLKQEENKRAVIAKLVSIDTQKAKDIEGVYDVITIDPPWNIETTRSESSTAGYIPLQYPTMSVDEIKALKIPYAEHCHVFLWTTQKFLKAAFDVLNAWGLEYVCTFTWAKNGGPQVVGLPQYNTEFFLYGRRGMPRFIETKNFFTLLEAKKGKHSEKPKEFYDLIRHVTAGRRLDMFNRRTIEGFDAWGNEEEIKNNKAERM